ncbi:hypothetical protein PLESTB_000585900 [Pleodorina starrii]|uniref:Uncharacterized protein n=1 Tax=Pleodorina starrii TaxID=330485 RepID=A0A9W6BHG9_9CHLO|nr:hypothetical protein PLESTM_000298900 [Pleodorina starrii]GLC52128.1 hypothetical protein PLESTB_000585900 [Pleodorina starrii]GLC72270.1 hypothetical protein PLESTF_001226000 [Pleodorina starrii]
MSRDVWAERRELVEYVLKEHARRGGRVVAAPQTALYEPKVLDQLNIAALVKQLQHGGTLELARVLLPAVSIGANGAAASSSVAANGDNPFGAPTAGAGLQPSASTASLGGGGGGVGDNPFGPPSAGARHTSLTSPENPFGASGGGGGGMSGGGGGANPFGKPPPPRPSSSSISAADSAMFAKKKGATGGGGEPPVATISSTVKLSYSLSTAASPQRSAAGAGPLADASRGTRRGGELDGIAGGGGGEAANGDGGGAGPLRPPRLDLPQLETGQTDEQLRDLAYLLFAAVAGGTGMPQHSQLLPVMRQQLLIDDTRAADVGRVLRHLQPGGEPHLIDQPHPVLSAGSVPGGWRPSQRASLELLLRLVTLVRPTDFEAATPAKAFQGFLRWKDVTVAVLERQVATAVAAGWTGDKAQLRKMLARMHGAARRADVRGEGDFEEEEYGEATRVLAEVAGQLAGGCSTGMRFPWAVRVRLCEILITAVFDTLEEGSYIDEAALVMQFLDSVLFPALGLSPSAALAVNAWVHFSMYVGTGCREQRLVKQLKQHISRLAAAAAEAPMRGSDPFGLGPEATTVGGGGGPPPPPDELSRDSALAAQVANHIVDWLYVRLCDYHAAFPRGENLASLLDVFVFAARSRGDGPARLGELLVEAVCSSASAAYGSRMRARMDPGASNEMRLLEMASIAHDIHDADTATYCAALTPHMPAAIGVAAVHLHKLYGQHLGPWLNLAKNISPAVLDVFRTAHVLEQRLAGSLAKTATSPATATATSTAPGGPPPPPPAVTDVLSSFRRWDLAGPLKAALLQWVAAQVTNMGTWTARALQTEKWKSLGSVPDASHTASAAEVSRMTVEALDALYGMDVPMPPEVPAALLEGVDGVMRKYVTYVNDKLGALQRLIPPVPPLTRYKKDLVSKNEQAERDAGRATARGGNKQNKVPFLASVPPVESSPDFTNISASLTPEVLTSAACSLHYLYGRAEALVQSARERQLQSLAAHAGNALPLPLPPPSPSPSSPSPASPGGGPSPGSVKGSPAKSEGSASVTTEPPEPLSHARTALMTGMQYACKFLATRVVFWDQRTPWLELLYRHQVSQPSSRIELVLEGLHRVLAATCPALPDPVRSAFAKHLMVASVMAMERVLLDGGPCRWFTPADVQPIDQDLHKLRALFHADGEGLDREVIDGELERVRRLLPLLKVEVGPLMDLLKTARTHGTAQLMASSGGPGSVYDESTLMRVLVHRPERNGSKMLKTLYKLSKKMK